MKHRFIVYGAGAIGTTLAAYLHQAGLDYALYARPQKALAISQQPQSVIRDGKTVVDAVTLNVIDNLDQQSVTHIIITVKNYQLEQACEHIKSALGDNISVLGLQNGVANQSLLPQYFNRVVYGIVFYNVWQQQPGIWGHKDHGPLLLGQPNQAVDADTKLLANSLAKALPCETSEQFQDEVHGKLVSNLSNSVTTLIGNSHSRPEALKPLQKIFTALTYEAVKLLRSAGFKQAKYSALPPWLLVGLSPYLPGFVLRPIFRKKIALIGSTSMAQDIIDKGSKDSELDSINGYLLALAEQTQVTTPLAEKLYQLCQQNFQQQPFEAMTAQQLWRQLQA